MKVRRTAAFVVLAGLVASCGGGGGGDSADRTRNVAIETNNAVLPFPATNGWIDDIRWSEEAQKAIAFTGDATYTGLFVGGASVVKTSDPNDETVPASFPVTEGVKAGVPDGNGGWYLGGQSVVIDRSSRGKMVHILADGTVDNAFFLNVTPAMSFGLDLSMVSWMAMHPNGRDVLAAISNVTAVSGEAAINGCSAVYVVDGATGMRKTELEPKEQLGCVYEPVVVGHRLFALPGGNGNGVPLLVSIDLTTGLKDNFVDELNARFPYFNQGQDYQHVMKMVVRGDILWVFGTLDRQHHRVAKFDLTTGHPVDFSTAPVETSQFDDRHFDYAVTDTHVMVHVRERGENGEFLNTFRVFDALTGSEVAFTPELPANVWSWSVQEVSVWRNSFLISGSMSEVNGRKVRGVAVLDATGKTADSQLPYTANDGGSARVYNLEFGGADRTLVVFGSTMAMYDAYYTGPILVTDRNGVPQEFRLGDDTEGRDISGIGVVGAWLYVASVASWAENEPLWMDSRVDRFDLVTGTRDEGFRIDTSGTFVYDVYGDVDRLALLLYENKEDGTQPAAVSLRSAADGAESNHLRLLVDGEAMLPGEATVSEGKLYLNVLSQQGIEPPPAARIDLATAELTFVTGVWSSEYSSYGPTLTSKGLMLPRAENVLVIDPSTMEVTGSVDVGWASDVAEAGGRLVVNVEGVGMVDLEPNTLAVNGVWGPRDVSWSRVVGSGDGFVASLTRPRKIASDTVASGLVGLRADGTPVVPAEYRLKGSRPKADSPEVVQSVSPQVLTLPGAPEQQVPQVPGPNATTQRASERASIVNMSPGDRSINVTFRPVAGGGTHTVRVVDGRQSCSSMTGSCTVKGLTAGTAYRFVVIPGGDAASVSLESIEVRPWVSLKKGAVKSAKSLLKVPAKGTAKWKVKGAACGLKGAKVTGKKKGQCTLTVSVRTKSGTIRAVTVVRVI